MGIFKSADILIPNPETDFSKWSVVACDQYTSEPKYWESVREYVGDAPSTLNIIYPEIYLDAADSGDRIARINKTMEEYMPLFDEYKDSYIYVERIQSDGRLRRGIVGVIDLEEYDFSKGSVSAVRATEGTIIERIPPRKRIRENATLELPHIMMLTDDKECKIIEPLSEKKAEFKKLYDFDLMMSSGHITGYLLNDEAKVELDRTLLAAEEEKRAENPNAPLIFAVGDGNHSLATAKTCWEEIKKNTGAERHPARYALAELVNLYDTALEFEPIHRVLFDVEPNKVMAELEKYYPELSYEDNGGQKIKYCFGENKGTVYISNAPSNLAIGTIQKFIDSYIEKNGGRADYIHGEDVVEELSRENGRIGFMVDGMEKTELYPTVIKDGSLPRKTFSMGNAADKRFYLEAKRIK